MKAGTKVKFIHQSYKHHGHLVLLSDIDDKGKVRVRTSGGAKFEIDTKNPNQSIEEVK